MIHNFEPAIPLPDRSSAKRRKRNLDNERITDEQHDIVSQSGGDGNASEPSEHVSEQDSEQEQETGHVSNEAASPPRSSPGPASSPLPSSRLSGQQRRNLRHQHLHTLTTVLHKCLQARDYPRASRAFGLLLRFEVGGRRMDVRKNHLWGIGAEILLHRDKQRDHATGALYADDLDEPQDEIWFTDEGFETTKKYYERLIVQYPYRTTRPNDVSAMQFHPVMFELWINHIQGRSKRARRKVEMDFADRIRGSSNPEDDIHDDITLVNQTSSPLATDREGSETQNHDDMISGIRKSELRQATQLIERIERVTALPPYDRISRLLRQQGMVYLWIADLCDDVSENISEAEGYRAKAKDTFLLIRRYDSVMWEQVKHYVDLKDDEREEEGMKEHRAQNKSIRTSKKRSRKKR